MLHLQNYWPQSLMLKFFCPCKSTKNNRTLSHLVLCQKKSKHNQPDTSGYVFDVIKILLKKKSQLFIKINLGLLKETHLI